MNSELILRRYEQQDFEPALALTLRAFEEIHEGFQRQLGQQLFRYMKPDWREGYREQLSTLVEGEKRQRFWVAKLGGQIAGYAVWDFMEKPQEAELLLLCVDPAFRRRGVASALNQQVLTDMRHNGVRFAMVETGGDAAHAGARAAYEKVGFVPLACVRYFQLLDEDMKENDNEPSTQG